MSHYIRQSVGLGNNGSLAELRRNLAWWEKRPSQAATPRGQQRIASLQRQIAEHEAELAELPF